MLLALKLPLNYAPKGDKVDTGDAFKITPYEQQEP